MPLALRTASRRAGFTLGIIYAFLRTLQRSAKSWAELLHGKERTFVKEWTTMLMCAILKNSFVPFCPCCDTWGCGVRKTQKGYAHSSRRCFWRKVEIHLDEFWANRRTFLLRLLEVIFVQTAQNIFKLLSKYKPTGDQPQAIDALVKGFQEGNQFQTLLGVQVLARPI